MQLIPRCPLRTTRPEEAFGFRAFVLLLRHDDDNNAALVLIALLVRGTPSCVEYLTGGGRSLGCLLWIGPWEIAIC